MSQHHTPFLYPTQLNIPPEIRVYGIQMLNQTLACTMDLRSHAKQVLTVEIALVYRPSNGISVHQQANDPVVPLYPFRDADHYADSA